MLLRSLSLTNFRNYTKADFSFSPQTTVIVGPNTAGKTNILEAISMLATGKSFRATYDREVIKNGESVAHLECSVNQQGRETFPYIAVVAGDRGENVSSKRFKINGVKKTRADFVGQLRAAIFSPEEIALVTGSPSRRRRYIDSVLSQIDRDYARTLLKYEKVLRQRNRLLKLIREGEAQRSQLDLWDEKLLQLGPFLTKKRRQLFETINHQQLTINNLFLDYRSKVLDKESLNKHRDREIAAGQTFRGPHRDDFCFMRMDANNAAADLQSAPIDVANERAFKNQDLAVFGSRGEQRLAVLHLKLAELEFISEHTGGRPILLLDDIFSELDQKNRRHVLSLIDKQQTIITTTDLDHLDGEKFKGSQIINLTRSLPSRIVPNQT